MSKSILPTVSEGSGQDLPLPLIVAQKWGFPLAHVDVDGLTFYAISDWIGGLTTGSEVRKVWSDIKQKSNLLQMSDSIRQLPYKASDGKTYQIDHGTDKTLYLIAQHLRSTKTRPALAAIKRFLAESGAFVDEVRLNPDQAIDAAIAAYRAQGKDDRWIQARIEGKIKRNLFTAALTAAVIDTLTPRHYATATDDIYRGLWGRTAAYLKGELQLPKNANLRNHQPMLALHYQGIAEEVSAHKLGERQELAWDEARGIVQSVAAFIGKQAQETSDLLGMDIATGKPLLPTR